LNYRLSADSEFLSFELLMSLYEMNEFTNAQNNKFKNQ